MSGEHDLDTRQGSGANDTIEGATGEFVAVLDGGGDDHIDVTDAGGAVVVGRAGTHPKIHGNATE